MEKMKKYVLQVKKFWGSKEYVIYAKDKQTAIQIAKGIVGKDK